MTLLIFTAEESDLDPSGEATDGGTEQDNQSSAEAQKVCLWSVEEKTR